MEIWVQVLLGFGGCLTPIVIAAMARDRSLMAIIATIKTDAGEQIKSATDPLHERVNRVRDEFVRRDDLNAHLARWEKQVDELRKDMRTNNEKVDKRLDEIVKMLRGDKD